MTSRQPVISHAAAQARVASGGPAYRYGHRPYLPGSSAIALSLLVLAGCSSTPPPAFPETFSDTSTYSRTYPAGDKATCEAARRALLSQGYTIGKAQADAVEGQKNFQVEKDKHQVISFHVTCTSDHQASPTTSVFVSAVQDRYIIKQVSGSAGVGLSVLGSLSMPFGSSDDSLSKISSETISSQSFYEGFFDLMQRYLPKSAPVGAASGPSPSGTPAKATEPAAATPPVPAAGSAPSTPAAAAPSDVAPGPSGPPATSGTPAAAVTPATSGTPPASETPATSGIPAPSGTPSSSTSGPTPPTSPAAPSAPADAGSPAPAGQNAADSEPAQPSDK
jgi:hypothetical protein